MIDLVLQWGTQKKFYSRYLLLLFLIITLLRGQDNIESMINALVNAEVVGFIFDISFINIFVWMIIIIIVIEFFLILREMKNIKNRIVTFESKVNSIDAVHEGHIQKLTEILSKIASQMENIGTKILNILILIHLEGIFLIILNNFNLANIYIGYTLFISVIFSLIVTSIILSPHLLKLVDLLKKVSVFQNRKEKVEND